MITYAEAAKKFRLIDPRIDPQVEQLGKQILERRAILTQENHDDDQRSKRLLHWIENRLAQPHLGYLDSSQVNEIWGGSTTDALHRLGQRYSLALDKANPQIGADFMRAILDGTRPNELPMPAANSYDWLQRQVLAAGHNWTNKPMEFNVVGVRGYLVASGVVENIGNRFNDTIFLAWVDRDGKKQIRSWVASVDPGLYYYSTRPINPKGCAHLLPGQYWYQPGPHNGKPAFIQAEPVWVARSNSANYTDRSHKEQGVFWINIHPAFAWSDQAGVDASSAGCQVIKAAGWADWRWLDFYNTLKRDVRPKFQYTLLDKIKTK